jgi:hypothetical protein
MGCEMSSDILNPQPATIRPGAVKITNNKYALNGENR